MSRILYKSGLVIVIFIFLFTTNAFSQDNQYECKIETKKGENYHLIEVRGYGGFEFDCKKGKADFKLSFENIKTIKFTKKRKRNYRKANLLLTNGQMDEIWIRDGFKEDGHKVKFIHITVEGKSKEYGSLVRINVQEIKTITFLQ